MQRCDKELLNAIPDLHGHRFIDDYELGFRNRADAENAFHTLESVLAEFELALNPKKTKILELPQPLEAPWADRLRSFRFRSTTSGQASDLQGYFNLAYSMHSDYPDEAVLQYAISRLRNLNIDSNNADLFQRLLLLCVAPEPAVLRYVLQLIIRGRNAGRITPITELEHAVNALMQEHAQLNHSSEVAWALWACLALGLRVETASVDVISKCEDSVIALLALDCEANGLVATSLDKTAWSVHMTQDALYSEHWLLAYEANVKGWLPSVGGGDHVNGDINFGFLKSSGVSFYDQRQASPPTPTGPAPVPIVPPPAAGSLSTSN
jgi:hypothetical protein